MEQTEPRAAERRFFDALVKGAAAELDPLLTEDFMLIDVMSGSEVDRAGFLGFVGSGQLRFESIEPEGVRERRYGECAVITGRTRMKGLYAGNQFELHSAYTHVLVEHRGEWRLASAQGTPVAG